MARPTRIEFAGAHYHVFARGERKDKIFLVTSDYQKFLEKLKETLVKFNIDCLAYALMPNHYHLYLVTNEPNLSKAMQNLNSSYTNWFKRKHDITGHIFQGRYKALLIDRDAYMDRVIDYIHLNPVKSEIEDLPWDYKWSSCKAYCTGEDPYDIALIEYYKNFSNSDWSDYKQHIFKSKNYNLPHRDQYKSVAIGQENYKKIVETKLNNKSEIYYEPSTKMKYTRDSKKILRILADYFDTQESKILENKYKNDLKKYYIYLLKKYSRLKNSEIGNLYGIKPSAISDTVRRFKEQMKKNKDISRNIKNIESELRRPDPTSF